jgi:hypothetical protein
MQQLHAEIIAWAKNGQPWKKGVAIFKQFSNNKNLIRRFEKAGPTDYNIGLLHWQLTEHARFLESIPRKRSKRKGIARPNENSIDFAVKPAEVQAMETKKYHAYMQARRIRFELIPDAKTKEERAALAAQVVVLMKENLDYWNKLKEYKDTGAIPRLESPKLQKINESTLSPLQMQKKLQYRRSNVSTYRRFIKDNPEHPSVAKKLLKIQEWEKEINSYESQLNQSNS